MNMIKLTHITQNENRGSIRHIAKTEYDIFEMLKDCYGATTRSYNHFKDLIERIEWTDIFNADGETYYNSNGFLLTLEDIDPFKEAWKPSVMFSDGSIISL